MLRVLGDGHQRKSYIYVKDCVEAMLIAIDRANEKVNIFNLGNDEYTEVNGSIGWITGHLGVQPRLEYTGGDRGWIGDSPFIFLDTTRIQSLGWKPRVKIREGVLKSVDWLAANKWVFSKRS
jgi:UDP-glucose 4-epimerase